jgi:CspA family cold shock protein
MAKGTVKWFNNTMKYGFVLSEDEQEFFVHFSEIQVEGYKTLKRGDTVEFEIEQTPKGPKAVKVAKIADAEPREKDPKKIKKIRRCA